MPNIDTVPNIATVANIDTVAKVDMERAGSSFGFIVAGDLHLSSETPRSRRDDFPHAVLVKLGQILNNAATKESKITDVILTGDVFNTKNISNQFLTKVNKLLRLSPLSEVQLPEVRLTFSEGVLSPRLSTVVGNHDLYHDRLSSLSQTPLGVLISSGLLNRLGIIRVNYFPSVDPHSGKEKKSVYSEDPWLCIQGFDYQPNLKLDASGLPASAYKIAVIHAFAGEERAFMPEQSSDWVSNEALAYSGFDWVIAGHDHVQDFFVVKNPETGQDVHVLIPGSVTRGTKHSYRRDQRPYIWHFNVESPKTCAEGMNPVTLKRIELQVAPADEVFSEEQIEREDVDHKIGDFVEALQATYVSEENDIYGLLDQLNLPNVIKLLIENYLTEEGVFR